MTRIGGGASSAAWPADDVPMAAPRSMDPVLAKIRLMWEPGLVVGTQRAGGRSANTGGPP